MKPAYVLSLTDADVRDIAFVGSRYAWSDALSALDAGENRLAEHEAWRIVEAFEADIEGGHSPFPMLDPRSDLCARLTVFWNSIV
jgi:hypothetical protein